MTWEEQQLDAAGYIVSAGAERQSIRTSVLRLLDVWKTMDNMDAVTKDDVLMVFSTLARGHALITEDDSTTTKWFSATVVRPRVGDRVRVKADAYLGSDERHILNGVSGHVARITRGMYVVTLISDDQSIRGTHHIRPVDLETAREVRDA